MITNAFDSDRSALLEPSNLDPSSVMIPETVVVTFQASTFASLRHCFETTPVVKLGLGEAGPSGVEEVFTISHRQRTIGVYLSSVGAPSAVGAFELAIAAGAKRFLFFGTCGTLIDDLAPNDLIVPTAAWRDEGTSYHYLPASDEIAIPTANRLSTMMAARDLPHRLGKIWTTDAIFRETRRNTDLRRAAGCIAVDMEIAALQAVTQFRGVEAYFFVYGADALGVDWDQRTLGRLDHDSRSALATIAIDLGVDLMDDNRPS
ncbi:MAG: nucleoside phosphorylase [Propionibacteriaceae bacterium]|jgi:uridine phosphorylase|nr:nucleoside phosphorylase [Propionibacteriaceae bacterium]